VSSSDWSRCLGHVLRHAMRSGAEQYNRYSRRHGRDRI
jgi:hypothetical protein